jgi:hypothetical protein
MNRLALLRLFLICAGMLVQLFAVPAFAKGTTTQIDIEGASLRKSVEIHAPRVIENFQVFAGPGTSTNEPHSLIADWAGGEVGPPPSQLERYRVSFHVMNYPQPYVVLYVLDASGGRGYVYIPGKGESYATNVGMIIRRVEGKWFRTLESWDTVARPLINKDVR